MTARTVVDGGEKNPLGDLGLSYNTRRKDEGCLCKDDKRDEKKKKCATEKKYSRYVGLWIGTDVVRYIGRSDIQSGVPI